jgi:hypothetical protein
MATMNNTQTIPSNVWLLACMLLMLLCAGCQHSGITLSDEESNLSLTHKNTGSFGPRPDLPTADDIHRLTPAQQQDFLTFMNNPRYQNTNPNSRLGNYITQVR